MQDKRKTAKQTNNNTDLQKTVLMLLVAVAAGFFGGYFGAQVDTDNSGVTSVTRQIVEGEENLINQIAKDVSPSVVSVNVTSTFIQQDFFGFGTERQAQSAGTGVIISEDGLIITNRHVVPAGDTSEVSITLADNTEVEVDVVGRTNESDPLDIAFLKIRDTAGLNLVVAEIGDSDEVEVGDRAIAIGNALGRFQNTVTSGIISGFGRDIEAFDGGGVETLQNLFQTDAAINGGNSGGPLVNAASQVIGINVATATAENISFAIPINDVKPLIDIVLENGELLRPFLGVRYVPLTPEVASQLDLSVEQGAYIPEDTPGRPSIVADSPAELAGLQGGDVIIAIDGIKLDDDNSLVSILGKKQVDEAVDLTVLRGEEEITLQAVLQPVPEDN